MYPLFADELAGLVPDGHPLAGRAFLQAADFKAAPFVTSSSAPEKGRQLQCFFLPGGVVPEWLDHAGSSDTVCSYVAQGFGRGVLRSWAAMPHESASTFGCMPLTATGLRAEWNALTREDTAKGPALSVFSAQLTEWSVMHGPGA